MRYEQNCIEMRCDLGLMWFPSRYIPPAAEHSMSLQLFLGCGSSGLTGLVDVLVCKRSSSDLGRYEPNCIEMRCDCVLMRFPSRYIPPSAEHSMSLQLFLGSGCSGLQKVIE